jgi:polyribonucleotide nucleotidyltransferase
MLGAVVYGHEQMQAAINAINELADEGGKDDWDWEPATRDEVLVQKIRALAEADLNEAYRNKSKSARRDKLDEIQNRVFDVGKQHFGKERLRDWFGALYETLLGSSQGPRMGSFIALYGIDNSRRLIAEALAAAS